MLQHIKRIEESNDVGYINKRLQHYWVLLKIIELKNGFLYIIGKPYLFKG